MEDITTETFIWEKYKEKDKDIDLMGLFIMDLDSEEKSMVMEN